MLGTRLLVLILFFVALIVCYAEYKEVTYTLPSFLNKTRSEGLSRKDTAVSAAVRVSLVYYNVARWRIAFITAFLCAFVLACLFQACQGSASIQAIFLSVFIVCWLFVDGARRWETAHVHYPVNSIQNELISNLSRMGDLTGPPVFYSSWPQ